MKSTNVYFDLKTGLAPEKTALPLQRRASNMVGIYHDEKALQKLIDGENPLMYEFYDLHVEEAEGNLAYGTSMVFPGLVGEEFYMTKGHFHTILDTAEVYYCLAGSGLMLMESPEGDVEIQEMKPGSAIYVPGRYAHRSINISSTEKLVTFFVFRADAGHDYGTIEDNGFRNLVVRDKDGYKVIDNPKWSK